MDQAIFREYDIRGVVGAQLTDDTVMTIARALGTFFSNEGAKTIALGFDARESSPRFAQILTGGLLASGCDVVSIGIVPTPVLYHTVYTKPVDGGVMITGSHNPPDHNGFKICLGKSTLFGEQIREIRDIAQLGEFASGAGEASELAVVEGYIDDLVVRSSRFTRPLKVVVDAGNGMGGVTAVPVYKALGADVIEQFTDPDPSFPNHHPDPTVIENLAPLIDAVRGQGADVGIAFDGDGDRIGVVDETGRIIWGDELMIAFSRSILASSPGAVIIGEVKCSQVMFDEIAARGGEPIMWKAGHSIIKAKMKETGALLAGEMSGHMFFADRFYGFDDATYAGARLLEILAGFDGKLSEIFADIPKTYSTPELRVDCPDAIKFEVVAAAIEYFSREHEVVTVDGARISFANGWGLVRASNTQELLVLRFEADTPETLKAIRSEVELFVRSAIASR